MLVGSVNSDFNKNIYKTPSFQGNCPIKFYSCRLNLEKDTVELVEKGKALWSELAEDIPTCPEN